MRIEELYHKLNLSLFTSNITNWVKKGKYPIGKVTLYLNADPEDGYVLVAEVPPFPEKCQAPPSTENQHFRLPHMEYPESARAIIDLYNETEENCAHFYTWLPKIYKSEPPGEYRDEWMWINVEPGEELDDETVQVHSAYDLYEDTVEVPETKKSNKITISTPEGTIWGNIIIRIVNEQRIEIITPGDKAALTTEQLGLKGKRALWPLLKLFAQERGTLLPKGLTQIKANVSSLRKLLQGLFPDVEGTPIKNFKRETGYVCNFTISIYELESMDDHENASVDIMDHFREHENFHPARSKKLTITE